MIANLPHGPTRARRTAVGRLPLRLHGAAPRRAAASPLAGLAMALGLGLGALVLAPDPAAAKVFASQNQALREAFPEATRIERDSRILLSAELERVRELSGQTDLPRVVVLHTAWKDEELLGFAHIDVHTVRTKPEAFMIVLTPEGAVRSVRVLAFHEPLDYLPTDRWYAQFEGRTTADRLRVGSDVHGVVGATLSARAAADGVRRVLAYWAVLLEPEHGAAAPPAAEGAVGRSRVADGAREGA